MNFDETRGALAIIGIMLAVVSVIVSFSRYKKKIEYRELLNSGQKLNLNLATLLPAYFRKKSDPLREAHVKIAKIGLIHVAVMLLSFIFVPTLVVLALRLLR